MLGPFGFLTGHPYWWLGPAALVFWMAGRVQRDIARKRLRNEATKRPIVDWEMARTKERMDRLLASWGEQGRQAAKLTLVWDFAFLAAYGLMLSLLCSVGARYLRLSGSSVAATIWAWGAWVALAVPILDVVENVLLWRMLRPFQGDRMPRTMVMASTAKWAIGLCLALLLAFPALLFDLAGYRFDFPSVRREAPKVDVTGLLSQLVIAPEGPRQGYQREAFGSWLAADGNGCNTRKEVLKRDSLVPATVGPKCEVISGEWLSLYDGMDLLDPGQVQIDHVVPLGEAWDSGASQWDSDRRRAYFNDLNHREALIAVSASSNASKGDRDPAEWEPRNHDYWCTYAVDWLIVKVDWGLSADDNEVRALHKLLATC
jgi:hypothetical protein